MTVGKRVLFDETWAVVKILRQERRRSLQQLAMEAFADLLVKHGHPVELKEQMLASIKKDQDKPSRRRENVGKKRVDVLVWTASYPNGLMARSRQCGMPVFLMFVRARRRTAAPQIVSDHLIGDWQ